jgi:hypothetical protein
MVGTAIRFVKYAVKFFRSFRASGIFPGDFSQKLLRSSRACDPILARRSSLDIQANVSIRAQLYDASSRQARAACLVAPDAYTVGGSAAV